MGYRSQVPWSAQSERKRSGKVIVRQLVQATGSVCHMKKANTMGDEGDVGLPYRCSAFKGSFVDAFLLRMKKKRDPIFNRKIWSRRSSISPEFVDCSVRINNGKTPVRCKITEGKVGHKFGEFASTRKRRPSRTNIGPGRKKGKK
uniref:Ribosomal protein S19, mitochondrial-like n=1 Tax=Nicotiana tabacum TaxID=4097 RepID=A0A1S3YKA0_TOBAC|nr:PREDICTED: ribosomal protein S19, mitochondrial-like [Nicotiana tabacum]